MSYTFNRAWSQVNWVALFLLLCFLCNGLACSVRCGPLQAHSKSGMVRVLCVWVTWRSPACCADLPAKPSAKIKVQGDASAALKGSPITKASPITKGSPLVKTSPKSRGVDYEALPDQKYEVVADDDGKHRLSIVVCLCAWVGVRQGVGKGWKRMEAAGCRGGHITDMMISGEGWGLAHEGCDDEL